MKAVDCSIKTFSLWWAQFSGWCFTQPALLFLSVTVCLPVAVLQPHVSFSKALHFNCPLIHQMPSDFPSFTYHKTTSLHPQICFHFLSALQLIGPLSSGVTSNRVFNLVSGFIKLSASLTVFRTLWKSCNWLQTDLRLVAATGFMPAFTLNW